MEGLISTSFKSQVIVMIAKLITSKVSNHQIIAFLRVESVVFIKNTPKNVSPMQISQKINLLKIICRNVAKKLMIK